MSVTWFIVVFALSGGAMALWIDNRFPSLTPEDLRSALIRLFGGLLLVHLALAALDRLVDPLPATTEAATVVAVAFALLTIAMLTAIWVIKVAQGMMGGSLR